MAKQNKTLSEFVTACIAKHSGRYSYCHIVEFDGMGNKYPIECPEHGIFNQTASGHQRGEGCPSCAKEANNKRHSYTFDDWFKLAKIKHGEVYDYSMMLDLAFNSNTKVPIICRQHGIFYQRATNHISYGTGCKKCKTEKPHLRLGKDEIIKRCNETHSHFYDYSLVGNISHTKEIMKVICPLHGTFDILADRHSAGAKCDECRKIMGNTRKQHRWLNQHGLPNDAAHREVRIQLHDSIGKGYVKVDGYNPLTNTVYEFWGDYWHGNPQVHSPEEINRKNKKTMGTLYTDTMQKRERILAAGYQLVEIWEHEWDNRNK